MTSSVVREREALAQDVRVTADELVVELVDGRTVSVPIHWYPRLAHGTADQWRNWQLIGHGIGIHWPDLDEDIAVEDLLAGRPSNESRASLQRWLNSRGLLANTRMQPTREKPRASGKRRRPRG